MSPRTLVTALAAAAGFVAAALMLCLVGILLWPVLSEAKEVQLKWKTIKGAKSYNLQVARDGDFNEKVFSKTLSETNLPYDLKSGEYFLRVQGIDKLGRAGEWSKPFKLVVTAPIAPVAQEVTPKKISYIAKSPTLKTEWKAKEAANDFKVIVKKDGQEVMTKETQTPKVDFKAQEPGHYEVEVASGVNHVFGTPVKIDQYDIEKKDLLPPKWQMPAYKKYNNKKPVEFRWQPVEGVESYHVVVFREKLADNQTEPDSRTASDASNGRFPAASNREVAYETSVPAEKLRDHKFVMPPLPPGRYVAAVESVAGETEKAPSTSYQFDVKRAKPVEFDRFDIAFSYALTPISYEVNVQENPYYSKTSSFGGKATVDGTLWFPDSEFGLRAQGSWGGFLINNTNLTYNDLMAAAIYRWDIDTSGLRSQIKPYLGGRAYTMPALIPGSGNGGGGNNLNQVFNPSVAGGVLGLDVIRPLSEKFALVANLQITVPVWASNAGTYPLNVINDPNTKVAIGSKIALPGSLRLLAMAGYQEDNLKWHPGQNNNQQQCSNCGNSQVKIGAGTFIVGVEASDDGNTFSTRTEAPGRPDRFSDFDFAAAYKAMGMSYNATLPEFAGGSEKMSAPTDYAGSLELTATGWLRESHHGVRAEAGWGGFTIRNLGGSYNISYPEFNVQWGYRPSLKPAGWEWNWQNFAGLRMWAVPLLRIDVANNGNNGGQTVSARLPQLLGPEDTFVLSKKFAETWALSWTNNFSTPLLTTNKDGEVNTIKYGVFSVKSEVGLNRIFSPDLNGGVGLGVDWENFEYEPSAVPGQTSRVNTSSPYLSLFATYAF